MDFYYSQNLNFFLWECQSQKYWAGNSRTGPALLNYLDNWEEFTIWRELYKDPDSEIDKDLLRSFDKHFSAYHQLLTTLVKVIKPAKVVPPQDILDAYDATQKFETLLKGYFGKNLKGGSKHFFSGPKGCLIDEKKGQSSLLPGNSINYSTSFSGLLCTGPWVSMMNKWSSRSTSRWKSSSAFLLLCPRTNFSIPSFSDFTTFLK